MSGHASLFAPCPDYVGIVPESRHDCAECQTNYGERACPDFQDRFLRTVCRELDLELWQMRFVAHMRLSR
jgi:hypothetical protein